MAEKLDMKKVSLSLGILFAIMHGIGSLAITTYMKYWQWAHFMTMQYTPTGFNVGVWIGGIVVAFVCGAVVGGLYTLIYNKL